MTPVLLLTLAALAVYVMTSRANPDDETVLEGMMDSGIKQKIIDVANQYGVDPALALAVAHTESRFRQDQVSPAGALGVFQLMPATAAGLGVDPTDEDQNIDGGIRYLKQMLDGQGGSVSLALAAYNAGPGNVQKYGGVPPFQETQDYIARVTRYAANAL